MWSSPSPTALPSPQALPVSAPADKPPSGCGLLGRRLRASACAPSQRRCCRFSCAAALTLPPHPLHPPVPRPHDRRWPRRRAAQRHIPCHLHRGRQDLLHRPGHRPWCARLPPARSLRQRPLPCCTASGPFPVAPPAPCPTCALPNPYRSAAQFWPIPSPPLPAGSGGSGGSGAKAIAGLGPNPANASEILITFTDGTTQAVSAASLGGGKGLAGLVYDKMANALKASLADGTVVSASLDGKGPQALASPNLVEAEKFKLPPSRGSSLPFSAQ
jgi:hypothetical protein